MERFEKIKRKLGAIEEELKEKFLKKLKRTPISERNLYTREVLRNIETIETEIAERINKEKKKFEEKIKEINRERKEKIKNLF